MGSKSFENPLLSHARMRGLYRGLVEAQALRLVPRGAEACFVAACIDLKAEDFALCAAGRKAPDYLRALGARPGSGVPRAAALRKLLDAPEKPFAGSDTEALLCAAGAAMAMRAAGGEAVALALLAGKAEVAAEWVRVLRATGAAELPLVFVALPASRGPDWTAVGKRAGIPVIPVEAADAVALYRVAQESIGRARADRRGAVIECVAGKADPARMMADQLLARQIAGRGWIETVSTGFRTLSAKVQ